MIRAAMSGRDISLDASPDDITHYLYVEDAVNGLICAGQAGILPDRVYNITAGSGIPMRRVVEMLRPMGRQCTVTLLRQSVAAGGPSTLDNHRAARDLGVFPATPLDEGLRLYRDALLV